HSAFLVVGEIESSGNIIGRVQMYLPDVVLLEALADGGTAELVQAIREVTPAHVVVFGAAEDPAALRATLLAGASGYVASAGGDDQIVSALTLACQGMGQICAPLGSTGLAALCSGPTPGSNEDLT